MRPDKPTSCFGSSGLFVLLALLWLPLQSVNAAVTENGSRIADSTRSPLAAIDTDYTLTSNSQLIVYAAGAYDATDCRLRSGEGGHSPQYRVLAGSWANVPTANGSGPYLEATGTVLTNNSSVSSGERLANTGGSFVSAGKEFTTSTNLDYSGETRQGQSTEAQWAMNFSTSPDNTTYEFRMRWGTKDCGTQYVTYSARITTASSGPHFAISHDGSADVSVVENITIAHHDGSHSVDTSYTGTITLSTSTSNGDWSLVTGSGTLNNSGNGDATYTYVGADNGSVVLGLVNTNAEILNIDITDGSYSEDASEDDDLSSVGPHWGRDAQNPTLYTTSNSRSMGGVSPNTDDMQITEIGIYLGAQTGSIRLGVYTGGSLDDPTSATLLWDAGTVTGTGTAGWFTISTGGVSWPKNTPTWLGWKQNTGVGIYYSTSSSDAGDFQTVRGRNVNSFSQDPTVAFPATYGETGSFSNYWYSIYVGYQVVSGSDHFSISHDGSAETSIVESITIAHHDGSHSVDTSYTGTITLSTSTSNGDWSVVSGSGTLNNSGSGSATYTYDAADNGSVVLGLLNTNVETLNIGVTDGTDSEDSGEDASLTFAAPSITHFSISHDGNGINCQVDPVTFTAHNAGHLVVSAYTGSVNLSTSTSHGDWSIITGAGTLDNATADDGAATYTYNAADNGSTVLGLTDTYAETVNIDVTDGSAIEDVSEDADLVFASSGFNFLADASKNTIATQIGGKASDVAPGAQTFELEAVRTSDDTGACESALTGVNSVELAFECENPGACTARQVAISGTDIAGNPFGSVSSYTSVNLDFGDDTDTTATFTLYYPDVGQLQLHARRTLAPSGETMLGASNAFVVRPFALHVDPAGNPAASSSAGSAFTNAGVNFTTTVNAVLWSSVDDTDYDGIADNHDDTDPSNNADLSDNLVALNYGQETAVESVTLTATLDQPSGGTDPGLSGGTTIASFSAGSGASSTVRFDEVGIIEMSATIADGDYLGIGVPATAAIAGKSGYVGRFNPARYAVTTSNIVAACSTTFTYARQPFSGSLTLEAQNGAAGGNLRTSNYRSGFVTLDPATELTVVNDQTAGSYDLQTIAFSQDFDAGTTGEAVLALQFRWDMAQQAPVTSIAQVTGVTDEVTVMAGAPVDIGSSPMRYGRVALGNALGSELVNLAVPMRTQYFLSASADFVTSTDDFCSSAVTLSFSDFADNLNSGDTCVVDTGSPGVSAAGCVVPGALAQRFDAPPVAGDFNLFLQASGDGNDGSVTVDADVPDWLKFDWDAAAPVDENPSGRVTFGIYDGSDRQIYRRELY